MRHLTPLALLAACTLAGCSASAQSIPVAPGMATAIFAGGCFWCVEQDFEKLPGVIEAESGYIGGSTPFPTYEQVARGGTGHTEAVRVIYDPRKVGYTQLLDYFWRHIDPTVKDRQFCDKGDQYRSGIYYQNETERKLAEASRDDLVRSGRFARIETEIAPAWKFWPAEGYHQDYYKKNPIRYSFYRYACGRDARVDFLWSDK